jgi:hypothetical protein
MSHRTFGINPAYLCDDDDKHVAKTICHRDRAITTSLSMFIRREKTHAVMWSIEFAHT